jgi:hypothetical protein
MICLFLFSACHKLPECENPEQGTIIYFRDICDTCADGKVVYIVFDRFDDTLIIDNKIQKKYTKNNLRVEVEWEISSAIHNQGPIYYPNDWCGPKNPGWIDIKCIQLL